MHGSMSRSCWVMIYHVLQQHRSLTRKLTALLLVVSITTNAYLLLHVPIKRVHIDDIVSLDDQNAEFLNRAVDQPTARKRSNENEAYVKVAVEHEVKDTYDGPHFEVKQPDNKKSILVPPANDTNNVKAIKTVKDIHVNPAKDKVKESKDKFVCYQTSKWTNHLVNPKQTTGFTDWSFKTKTKCPPFSVDKYPTQRQKVSLLCDGLYSKLVTSSTTSTRDIESVEFGNTCLADVIDACCKGKYEVPNVVHYIWYNDKDLGYFQFVSFMSALRFMKPCLILIHGLYIPRGKYWDYFVSNSPNIIHVMREKPTVIFGKKLAFEEHASDIMRIEALKLYGGIYLDFDEIILRPLEPLRKYDYTQGYERDVTMGSQLVIAKKNATFLNHWYNSYRDDYKETWAWNALWVPAKLSKQYPSLIHVEGFNFTRPNWQHVDLIYKHNYDWSTNYGMHIYVRWYTNETNNVIIRTLNTTIGAVCRHVLFGNKELCTH